MTEARLNNSLAGHGGNRESYVEEFGREPVDFSINVNPLGVSPLAKQAIINGLDGADRYPDVKCRALAQALAKFNHVDFGHVICGNGAADLIVRLALALKPQRALVCSPTFSEYERALQKVACKVDHFDLHEENNFAITEDILHAILPEHDLLVLCEPNNPTGMTTNRALLENILERCETCDALLMIDECFNGFLEDPEAHTMRHYVADHPRLFILESLTKTYGLAGVRVGYALCSDANLLEAMRNAGQPWAVSHLAQLAGAAALKDEEYISDMRAIIKEERPKMMRELGELGLKVFPSDANYILFSTAESESPDSTPTLVQEMAKRGLLIRNCNNFTGLGDGHYRVAVRTKAENDALLAALGDALSANAPSEERVW